MGQPKPVKKAVALKYTPSRDQAPRVAAKGQGLLAQKIIELARHHGIPIQEDPALVQVLAQLDFHQEIPPEAYLVVAEILAFVYSMNQRWTSLQPRKG
ncbi:MAG: EscU/YscU/HrcU family type III secretion system export apparatus switch protein [Deltaproteobacteria bacterium]|nr:EscU/YscU/HrcU family type III secretion system export apparatus switch protein [Deltaproteobacteria bacterium]